MDNKKSGALVETAYGHILVAELEDGSVKSVSVETAVNDLRWVIGNANLPETFDTTSLEVVCEYLKALLPEAADHD